MKKNFQITAIMLSALAVTNFAQAQDKSGEVSLKVILQPIQTLEVNSDPVELTYETKNDYENGATTTKFEHLNVYSIGGFNVSVQSKTATLTEMTGGEGTIESSGIKLTAKNSSGDDESLFSLGKDVPLTSGAAEIISSLKTALNRKFDITYHGSGDEDYIEKYIGKDGKNSVYTTTVTYTIAAQ